MHESPVLHVGINYAYAYTHAPHQQHSHLLHVGIKYACITSTAFTFAHLLLLFNNCKPALPPLPLSSCPLILTQPPTSFTTCCLFFFLGFAFSSLDVHCRNKITGHRGAWHFRLEKAQKLSSHACPISIRKSSARDGVPANGVPMQGTGKRPSRDWQTCPGRALANVPRQGTGKASQAGTAKRAQAGHWQTFPGRELASVPRQGTGKRPRQDCKHAQAGHAHWQAFPGRELASVPGRDCKRAQAGHWQMFPGREP